MNPPQATAPQTVSPQVVGHQVIRFYHVTGAPTPTLKNNKEAQAEASTPAAVDAVVARLLEIAVARAQPCLVVCPTDNRASRLDDALWAYTDESFLPHMVYSPEAHTADPTLLARQPVLLVSPETTPPELMASLANGRMPLVLAGAEAVLPPVLPTEKTLYLFHAAPAALATAREQWKVLKIAGYSLEYWQENGGKWARKQ